MYVRIVTRGVVIYLYCLKRLLGSRPSESLNVCLCQKLYLLTLLVWSEFLRKGGINHDTLNLSIQQLHPVVPVEFGNVQVAPLIIQTLNICYIYLDY